MTAAEKAGRLLAAGRVQVTFADEDQVRARVMGDHGLYEVTWEHGDWSCSCVARTGCSHRLAVKLVTLTPLRASAVG